MLNRTRLSLAITLSAMAAGAYAENIYRLDQVVVTAARTAQTVDETLAPVTVIDRAQIERSQTMTVAELLNQSAPGVQITSNGGPGSNSGVYIRGTKTAQTLILMDGRKINSASSGSAPLEYIDPQTIERIEVVRGPRSTLYGADAVGGVINIITRKGSGSPVLTVKAGGGSRSTGEYGLNYNGESAGTRFNLGARLLETQGYDRTVAKKTPNDANWDDDAFRNKSFSASLSRQLENDLEFGSSVAYFHGKSEYDNVYAPTAKPASLFTESMVDAYITKPMTSVWHARLEVGYISDSRKSADKSSKTDNKSLSLSWLNDIVWGNNQLLTTGIDYTKDRVDSTTTYAVDERSNTGVFVQNLTTLSASDVQLSGRYDDNEAFGSQFTGSAAWGFNLPAGLRLVASYGTAFRAPTFDDMYRQSFFSAPNPDLKPEFAKNAELELRGVIDRHTDWSVNVYQNNMDDMLNSAPRADGKWHTVNIDKARIRGIEFEASTRYAGVDVSTNLTVLDPQNRSGVNAGKKLHYRAQKLIALNADKDFGPWSLGGTWRAQGKTWTDPSNTKQIPGYGTVDLRASYQWAEGVKTQLKVTNLLDKEYQPVVGYRGEPRGIFATVAWSPKL